MTEADFESRVLAFELEWRRNGPCELARFLEWSPALAAEQRRRLLIELLCIDLEMHWRQKPVDERTDSRPRLESYVAAFPELGSLDQLPLELVAQEYRVRRQWGDRPDHAGFLARSPTRWNEIQAELLRVDEELAEEIAEPRSAMPSPRIQLVFGPAAERSSDVPVLSYRDFLLRRMIGAGSLGKVYEAWQQSAGRVVALKFLRKSFLSQRAAVERFVGEARIVARLKHPNIVAVYGLGHTPAGGHFIVMELVSGLDLDRRVKAGTISVEDALRWTIELCDALEHAHSRGIVHCDLKPANLLLDEKRSVRVSDFGLARFLNEQTPSATEFEGTAPFMAPEQVSRHFGPIDERTDVYGAGAVLYTLLTGQPVWPGSRLPDILARIISASPIAPPNVLRPEVPDDLAALCLKSLSRSRDDRFPTMGKLRSSLASLADTESAHPHK